MAAVVRLRNRELQQLLEGRQGPTMRFLMGKSTQMKGRARIRVGKRSHDLERSIATRPITVGGQPGVAVGVFGGRAARYAMIHHDGSRPHVIQASPGKLLRFEIGGDVIFAKRVRHPGTKPNRFLTDAARDVGLTIKGQRGSRGRFL